MQESVALLLRRATLKDKLSYDNVPDVPPLAEVCPRSILRFHAVRRSELRFRSTFSPGTCAYYAWVGPTDSAHDKSVLSFWPVILILLNLPECMRYDPCNIIIMYIATSATQGQPTNFLTHAGILAQELRNAAEGFDLEVGGEMLRVHVVVPMWALDGRGARAGTLATDAALISTRLI